MDPCTPDTGAAPIDSCLKSEAPIKLLFKTIFNSLHTNTNQDLVEKHPSVIKVVTMKSTDNFHYACKGSHHMQPQN